MVTVELGDEERQTLVEMLEQVRGEIGFEISDTDRLEYRNELKRRRAILDRLIEALRPGG
jgi:hypothetical protein